MEPKFNFYDFVGLVIPGALVLVLLHWLFIGFFALVSPLKVENAGGSILFLVAAYSVGHLVQPLGNRIERRQVERWGGWFSEQYLRDDNKHYSSEFKTKLKECATEQFGLSPDVSLADDKAQKDRRQEIFSLCYSLIIQEKVAARTEMFNGIYGLYRGMCAVLWIGIIVGGAIALKHLVLLILSALNATLPQGAFFHFEGLQLGLGVAFFIFFVVSIRPLESRLKRFARHFVNSVYWNFYVWCTRKGVE